jgi:AraC-like DNA-binding protein
VPAVVETAQANSARRVFSRGHRPQLKILPKLNSQISQKFGSSLSYRQVGEEPLVIKQMPGSITSVFSEAEDFEAALRDQGCLGLLVAGPGVFRARLTQVALHRLRLSAAEEHLPRVAFVAVPADMILVLLPRGSGPPPIWGGITMRAGEIMTLGPSQRLHTRTEGPCRWGSLLLPALDLARYGSALTGAVFAVPSAARTWRPRLAVSRHLRHLHSAAIKAVESRSQAFIGAGAAHGLEQQIIHALVECLSAAPADGGTLAIRRHRDIAVRFESLIQTQLDRNPRMAEICSALGVSDRTLRQCCEEQLGTSPTRYLRLCRMQLVRRALYNGSYDGTSVSATAVRYGFRGLGRFAADYRAVFGELPSATLRQGWGLTLHRRRSRL